MEASRDELAILRGGPAPSERAAAPGGGRRDGRGARPRWQEGGGRGVGHEPQHGDQGRTRSARRASSPSERQRALGGGDIKSEDKQPGLLEALDELVHPETRGNPMSYLRWTSKSTGKLAAELVRQGYKITDDTVGRILRVLGYSLQAPSKQKEGSAHPDRDAQFVYLNKQIGALHEGRPAGDQRRHQEEGAGRRVLQRRGRVAPRRRADADQDP